MNINCAIRIFAKFLDVNWELVNLLFTGSDNEEYSGISIDDWIQCNWELLVERIILSKDEYLEIYGEGADFYGEYSRITDVKSVETHSVKVLVDEAIDILNGEKIKNEIFNFEQLVGFKNKFYVIEPPFSYILAKDDDDFERVFSLEDVNLEIERIIRDEIK